MKKKIVLLAVFLELLLAPVANADGISPLLSPGTTFKDLVFNIVNILDNFIPILIGAAVIVFLYGVFLFVARSSKGDVDDHKEGKNFMIFGIIGIAVMVSLWGLVSFVTNTFGTSSSVIPQIRNINM